jgi:putative iron-dependent peroxidase
LLQTLGDAVTMIDEVSGFRYFDARDLLGFVDGTANPVGHEIGETALVGDEDPEFAGGGYVVVQKYLHDLSAWGGTSTALQEEIIGRTKIDNIELDDGAAPRKSTRRWPPSSMRTATSTTSCATTCRSAAPGTASSAPTSSATHGTCG